MTKLAKKATESMYEKLAGYTQHGSENEKARALAYKHIADSYGKADAKSPGMAFLKGTHGRDIIMNLIARKQAYKSQQDGIENLKSHIPFVGMGPAGAEALRNLAKKEQI